jgi:hypothetical protein
MLRGLILSSTGSILIFTAGAPMLGGRRLTRHIVAKLGGRPANTPGAFRTAGLQLNMHRASFSCSRQGSFCATHALTSWGGSSIIRKTTDLNHLIARVMRDSTAAEASKQDAGAGSVQLA